MYLNQKVMLHVWMKVKVKVKVKVKIEMTMRHRRMCFKSEVRRIATRFQGLDRTPWRSSSPMPCMLLRHSVIGRVGDTKESNKT